LHNTTKNLEVSTTNPFVNNINHGLLFDSSGEDKGDKSKHGHTSVHDLSFFGKASLEFREVTEGFLVLLEFKKLITERKRAKSGANRDKQEVDVGNKDDGTFVGDGALSRDGGKGSPLLQVKRNIGIRDKSMSFGVGGGTDEDPSEHSMAAVPLFSLDGRSPSPLGELRPLGFPVLHGIIEGIQAGSSGTGSGNSSLVDERGLGSKSGDSTNTEGKSGKGFERGHGYNLTLNVMLLT